MRLRLLLSFAAIFLIAAGSVAAALVVHSDDSDEFHQLQREEAARAAHQAGAVAGLSVAELANAAAFFQVDGNVDAHEFDVVARSLLDDGTLQAAAFIEKVPASERAAYEREHEVEMTEPGPDGLPKEPSKQHAVYYPVTYAVAHLRTYPVVGYDLGADPSRAPYLARARDTGKPVSTPVVPLIIGGYGINIFQAIYRDGAPTNTVAERRRALVGFTAGSFTVQDLAAAAVSAVSDSDQVQLQVGQERVMGPQGRLGDPARASFHVADRTWLLIVRDPSRPSLALPLLLGGVGIALAALLAALIFVWSRQERMQELEREASEDPLTGLKNRRRFNEDLQLAMARARRERTMGALVMLDLDHFKRVNDTHGHLAGDRLIVEVATLLRRRTRESDVLARLGGDEFAVILPRCTVGEARLAAEAIATEIREHNPDGEPEPVTASLGVAMFGDRPRTNIAAIVSEADTAMYAAKEGGRDGVRVFDREAVRGDTTGPPIS
ncbi:MAG TPA: diguanylate cyclase [Solirubrobacterales bacterium]|nr:diguanylate cyclase [Solirubrobacterales bacterium]